MVSPSDAERLRQAQMGVRRLVERDLDRMWERLWSQYEDRPYDLRDAFLRSLPTLVSRYGEQAAALAADWYDEQREIAGAAGRFRATLQPSPYEDAVEGTVRRTAGALFTGQPEAMRTGLMAATGKYVLAAARQTIVTATDRDPAARGWQRVVRAGACGFCRMLAGRGGLYTKTSVHFASHDDCNCASAPSWDPNAPEVDVEQYRASIRTTALRERAAAGDQQAARALAQHNALIQRAVGEYA